MFRYIVTNDLILIKLSADTKCYISVRPTCVWKNEMYIVELYLFLFENTQQVLNRQNLHDALKHCYTTTTHGANSPTCGLKVVLVK